MVPDDSVQLQLAANAPISSIPMNVLCVSFHTWKFKTGPINYTCKFGLHFPNPSSNIGRPCNVNGAISHLLFSWNTFDLSSGIDFTLVNTWRSPFFASSVRRDFLLVFSMPVCKSIFCRRQHFFSAASERVMQGFVFVAFACNSRCQRKPPLDRISKLSPPLVRMRSANMVVVRNWPCS